MARIYSLNENHNCDYGVDFINGAAVVPDTKTEVLANFTDKGYTVVPGVDTLSPWDYLSMVELSPFAPYCGIDPTGMPKAALVAKIESQLALMKIKISAFSAINNVVAGTVAVPIFINAAAVKATLPTEVFCDAGSVGVPVAGWVDTDTFNPAAAGSYTFTATLVALPDPYDNTAAVTATIEVVVGA